MKVTTLGIDFGKERVPASLRGRTRGGDAAQAVATQTGAAVPDQAVAVSGWNGSLRRKPLLGARNCQARPSGAPHESAPRGTLREEQQELPQRRGGDL